MKWKPWKDYEADKEILPIKRPPCESCFYWKPIRKYFSYGVSFGIFDGIICCHSKNMLPDFSCWKGRGR